MRRLLRQGEIVRWAPGVYLAHRGAPTWLERAWGAVLLCWPGVLAGDSALRAEAGPGWRGRPDSAPILVAIDVSRRVRRPHPEVDVRRVAGLAGRALWHRSPPRMRFEDAALDSAIAAENVHDGIEALARAVRSRCTTADRLIAAVEARPKVTGRVTILGVLTDVRDGTSSVLEHGFLANVERAHALPAAKRQSRDRTRYGVVFRDVEYEGLGVVVELDGRLDHADVAERGRDLRRDLELAASGRVAIRLGWLQVFEAPCATAEAIGQLLGSRGWQGHVQACGDSCSVRAAG